MSRRSRRPDARQVRAERLRQHGARIVAETLARETGQSVAPDPALAAASDELLRQIPRLPAEVAGDAARAWSLVSAAEPRDARSLAGGLEMLRDYATDVARTFGALRLAGPPELHERRLADAAGRIAAMQAGLDVLTPIAARLARSLVPDDGPRAIQAQLRAFAVILDHAAAVVLAEQHWLWSGGEGPRRAERPA